MMVIKTKRLILRNPTLNDAAALLMIHNQENILRFNAMEKYNYCDMVKDIEEDNSNIYCLELVEAKKVIGAVFVNQDHLRYQVNARSLSYYLDEDYQGKGYMYEALRAVIIYLFDLGFDVISARAFKPNLASIKLLEKLGFVYEGCLRKGVQGYQGIVYDDMLYSLLKEDENLTG